MFCHFAILLFLSSSLFKLLFVFFCVAPINSFARGREKKSVCGCACAHVRSCMRERKRERKIKILSKSAKISWKVQYGLLLGGDWEGGSGMPG